MAVGNIIGSNIFNILFVLGITGVIQPLQFGKEFLFDSFVAVISILLLYLYSFKSKKLYRWQGISFLVLYISYFVMLIQKC